MWMAIRHARRAHVASRGEQPQQPVAGSRTARQPGARKRLNPADNIRDAASVTNMCKSPRLEIRGTTMGESCTDLSNMTSNLPRTIVDVPVELRQKFSCRTRFDSDNSRPVHVTYKTNGDLVISDAQNRKVKVFDCLGRLRVECDMPRGHAGSLVRPVCSATFSNGEIIVCDPGAGNVKLFTAEGKCLSVITSELVRPVGIVASNSGRILIADEAKQEVYIYRNVSDPKPKSLSALNAGRVTFNRPLHICLTSDEHIIVHDAGANKLCIFNKNGEFLTSRPLGTDIAPEESTQRVTRDFVNLKSLGATGMCATDKNDLLVWNCASSRIVRYNLSSNAITREITEENNNSVQNPVCVVTNGSGFMAVLENGKDCVKIFKYMA